MYSLKWNIQIKKQNTKPSKKKNGLSLKTLKNRMQNAIDEEDYEVAAKLRDKISRLEP